MLFITKVFIFAILTWSFIYTASYAVFVWRKKNISGAIFIFLIALASVIMPVLTLYIKG